MPRSPAFPLQVFYDGSCSVCARQMERYRRKAPGKGLIFVDISDPAFEPSRYGLTGEAFGRQMHAIDRRGRVYRGVEAFRALWLAFPQSNRYRFLAFLFSLAPVNLPARLAYRVFARLRKYLPRTRSSCDTESCNPGKGHSAGLRQGGYGTKPKG